MSRWTHGQWRPLCCWCRSPTRGIYVRHDPEMVACHGDHRDSKEADTS